MWKEKQLREDLRDLHKRILYLKCVGAGAAAPPLTCTRFCAVAPAHTSGPRIRRQIAHQESQMSLLPPMLRRLLKEGKRPVLDKVSLPLMERVGAKLATVVPIPSGSDLFLYAFIIVYCTHLVRRCGATRPSPHSVGCPVVLQGQPPRTCWPSEQSHPLAAPGRLHLWRTPKQINWLTGKSWDGLELSIGALQGWLYSLTFAKGVRGLGHLVIIFFRMLRADLLNWAIVYLIVLVAFSAAIFVVMTTEFPNPDTNVISGDFGSMSATIFTNFRFTFGDPSYTPYRQMPENQGWANFLFIAYSICTQVVLANLFIAMLNHTFDVNYKKADEARKQTPPGSLRFPCLRGRWRCDPRGLQARPAAPVALLGAPA